MVELRASFCRNIAMIVQKRREAILTHLHDKEPTSALPQSSCSIPEKKTILLALSCPTFKILQALFVIFGRP